MKWSFSQYAAFRICQRKWFYQYIYASSRAKDQNKKEASRLGKLVNIKAWRGKIVDEVISNTVIPSINNGNPVGFQAARQKAWSIFLSQKALGLKGGHIDAGDFRGFLEVEYGNIPTEENFNQAWQDIEKALKGFYTNSHIKDTLKGASRIMTQRRIPFSINGVSLMAIPDVVCFYKDAAPLIVDWKVQTDPLSNYWMQLAIYAIALTHCKPHKDWPAFPKDLATLNVRLSEMQLLTNMVRNHILSEDELEEVQETIICSASEMALARCGKDSKDLCADDFPSARSPEVCSYCAFKKLCWEACS